MIGSCVSCLRVGSLVAGGIGRYAVCDGLDISPFFDPQFTATLDYTTLAALNHLRHLSWMFSVFFGVLWACDEIALDEFVGAGYSWGIVAWEADCEYGEFFVFVFFSRDFWGLGLVLRLEGVIGSGFALSSRLIPAFHSFLILC